MKKAKKPTSRAAKKAPVTKKKSGPAKPAPKKKAPAAKAAAPKKAAAKVAAKPAAKAKAPAAPKKVEAKAKKPIVAKKAAEKAPAKAAAKPEKVKKTPEVKAKAEKEPKAEKPKKVVEPKAVEPVEPVASEDTYDEAEVFLTDAEGRRYCRVKDCDQIAMVDAYCRYHYLLFWKKIQVRKKILTEGKLERYIEELTARYPDKYLEMLRKDLRTEKDFTAAITELEIDDAAVDSEYEDNEAQSYLDEVRGHSGEGAGERDEEGF